jgi:hypothetical protein
MPITTQQYDNFTVGAAARGCLAARAVAMQVAAHFGVDG